MHPLVTSSLIAAGANLLGGLFGRSSSRRQEALYRDQLAQAQRQFDSQMDESIQRRVKDAQAAGIHPLFALGSTLGASPTVSASAPPDTGNAMGDAISRIGEALGQLPSQKAQIARDEAEAAFLNAQAARVTQDMQSRGRDALGQSEVQTFPYDPDSAVYGPPKYFRPEVPSMSRTGVVAGQQPGKIDVLLEDGRTIAIPNPGLGLDEVAQVEYVVKRARLWATDRIEAIANWIATDAPSNAEVRELERQLRAIKANPELARDSEAFLRGASAKVKDYWRRFNNWRTN